MSSERSADIDTLADTVARALCERDPFLASYMGIPGYEDAVPDVSADAQARWRSQFVDLMIRIEARAGGHVGGLRGNLVLAATRHHVRAALEDIDTGVSDFSVTPLPMQGPSWMLFTVGQTTVGSAAAASAYLERCRRLPTYLEAVTQRLEDAVDQGRQPVRHLVEQALTLCEKAAADLESTFAAPVRPDWDGAETCRNDVTVIARDRVRPALLQYITALRQTLAGARPPHRAGLLHVPGGTAAYAACARTATTLALDPDDVHRIGFEELAAFEDEVTELGRRVLGTRTATEAFTALRHRQPVGDAASLMAEAAAAMRRAEAMAVDVFVPPLADPCQVQAMPAHLADAGVPPTYAPPARDGSRPGAFLFNTSHPGPAGTAALEAVTFHETVPGHHAQLARLQQHADLPLLLSSFNVVAHSEGWGLYAERLADELGLYSDDTQRLGMMSLQAWRAVRLIVDTGLHARGWTRDQALRFAAEHTPMPEPFISAEIDRYIAVPGQALGYLIGLREIRRLRSHAKARAGGAFDIRRFHASVLDHGTLPLKALEIAVTADTDLGQERVRPE